MTYQILLLGLNPSFPPLVAKGNLSALFNITTNQLDQILSNPNYSLKKNMSEVTAEKYQSAIESAGGLCFIELESTLNDDTRSKSRSVEDEKVDIRQQDESPKAKSHPIPTGVSIKHSKAFALGQQFAKYLNLTSTKAQPEQNPEPDQFDSKDEKQKSPNESPNTNSDNLLIKCEDCGKQISRNSKTCLGCGAPNNWIHPVIANFIINSKSIKTNAEFRYEHTGTSLNGCTASITLSQVAFLLSALGFGSYALAEFSAGIGILNVPQFLLVPLLLAEAIGVKVGIICAIVGSVTRLIGDAIITQGKVFSVDFSTNPPVWKSNDETFWKPLKQVLKI
jgi:hypothetical protein